MVNKKAKPFDQEEAWETHRARLVGWLQKRSISAADAEDLAQEVLLKAWEKRDQLQDAERLQSWLFGIARNSVIDHFRKKDIAIPEAFTEADNEDLIVDLENCVEPFVSDLEDKYRHILQQVDLGTLNQKGYAETFDISYSTAKSRLQKARKLLAQRYRKCCHFQHDQAGRIYDMKQKKPDCEC